MDTLLSGGGQAKGTVETRIAVLENRCSNIEMGLVRMDMIQSSVSKKLDDIHQDILVNRGIREGQEGVKKWLSVLIPILLTALTYFGITFAHR